MSEVPLYTPTDAVSEQGRRKRPCALDTFLAWATHLTRADRMESYRGTSLIRNSTPPQDHHRALGIGLL